MFRRGFVATLISLGCAGCTSFVRSGGGSPPANRKTQGVRVTLAGQALLLEDACAAGHAVLDGVAAELKRGDVVFTDLETTIHTPQSGAPTRGDALTHSAEPSVLDCLHNMGINFLALANNHAWDRGTSGVLATRSAVAARGFGFAGTGESIDAATHAGTVKTPGGTVALVAMAVGKIREGAAATGARAGVNELRFTDGRLDPVSAESNLAAIRSAAASGDVVIAYLHNHEWGDDMTSVKPWSRDWARSCIDAGARLFVSHGAPLLQGIEWYRGCPLFHDLGNLFFQPRGSASGFPAAAWEGVIAQCVAGRDAVAVELVPIILTRPARGPSESSTAAGLPEIAAGADAARILSRLQALSADLGTKMRITGERAWLAT